ncbi:MAG: hypothetical protein LC118_13825 [Dehalococcoidia bacterium]|nr:hypothetical protein [Dehalococcoidia bacterium]
MGIAFGLVLVGSFLDWVKVGPFGAGAFEEDARFRICDWFDTTSAPLDGLVILALAVAGLLIAGLVVARRLRDTTAAMLTRLLGSVALTFGILQMQYIKSEAPSADWGMGLYLIVVGGVAATVAAMLPAKALGVSR